MNRDHNGTHGTGKSEHYDCGTREAVSGELAHNRRPKEIELLLNGDRPQRINDGMRRPAPGNDTPVPGKQQESADVAPRKRMVRVKQRNQPQTDRKEVKRPNAKNAA